MKFTVPNSILVLIETRRAHGQSRPHGQGCTVTLDFHVSLDTCDTLGNVFGRVYPGHLVLKLFLKVHLY